MLRSSVSYCSTERRFAYCVVNFCVMPFIELHIEPGGKNVAECVRNGNFCCWSVESDSRVCCVYSGTIFLMMYPSVVFVAFTASVC